MMDDVFEKEKKKPKGLKGGIYTEDSGLPPPQDVDGGSASPKKTKKMSKGGSASSRADGCCVRGKTKGRMI